MFSQTPTFIIEPFYVQKKQAQSLLLCYNDYQDNPDGQFLRLEVIV